MFIEQQQEKCVPHSSEVNGAEAQGFVALISKGGQVEYRSPLTAGMKADCFHTEAGRPPHGLGRNSVLFLLSWHKVTDTGKCKNLSEACLRQTLEPTVFLQQNPSPFPTQSPVRQAGTTFCEPTNSLSDQETPQYKQSLDLRVRNDPVTPENPQQRSIHRNHLSTLC